MFEELWDWEVTAARGAEGLTLGYFRQSNPEDALVLLMAVVRARYGVSLATWRDWSFWCVGRDDAGRPRQTLVFEVGPDGKPSRVADSQRGHFPQRATMG